MNKLFIAMAAVLMSSCGASNSKSNYEVMTSNKWELKSITTDNSGASVKPQESVTLIMSDSSSFSGHGGCNSYFGSYTHKGDNLDIEVKGRSMAMGPGIDFEDKYIALLDDCTTYFVNNDTLSLNNNKAGVTLKFTVLNDKK